MTQIIDAYLGLNALRQAGYKSTATAVAELVDNSIEADADNINIIAVSRKEVSGSRETSQVKSIAVLDDGLGMSIEVLSKCLSMGWGTRLNTRNGLGRFGFGLKGSSISQARIVEVYSWVNSNEIYMVKLDLDQVKEENLQELPKPTLTKLPKEIEGSLIESRSETGTLVVWREIDQIDFKRPSTLVKRINKDLCRIYRHFLDNDETYGKKRNIIVTHIDSDTGIADPVRLLANDPLYLLTPNNLPDHQDLSTNIKFEDMFSIDVPYQDGSQIKQGKVDFLCSIATPEIQAKGGNSTVGQHYGNNTGISFVRAGREIDFDTFGYISKSEPRHRWWGIEVRFPPELDEFFGVTNNKQSVRSIKKLDEDEILAYNDIKEEGGSNTKEEFLLRLNQLLEDKISAMMKVIVSRKEGSKEKRETTPITDKVNKDLVNNPTPTVSEEENKDKTDEEKLSERVRLLIDDDSALTEEQAKELAQITIDYKIDITTAGWPGHLFLDRRSVGNASVGIINRDTMFYSEFWDYLHSQKDQKGFEALGVLFMAFIRTEDELCRKYDKKVFSDFRSKWGEYVEELIHHAGS